MLRSFLLSKRSSNNSKLRCLRLCGINASSSRLASSSSASATASIQTRADLLEHKKKAHALYMLRKTPHVAMSTEAALRLITDEADQAHIPPQEKMSREEAAAFLRACHAAGAVIISPAPGSSVSKTSAADVRQMVYTDPVAVFNARQRKLAKKEVHESDDVVFIVEAAQCHQEHLQRLRERTVKPSAMMKNKKKNAAAEADADGDDDTASEKLADDPDTAAAAAVRSHRRFWALVGFAMSCQMLYFSYLTFLVYDWDTMEPFTYFVGCAYMCAFFAYFVLTRRGHTFAEMDKAVFSRAVKTVKKTAAAAKK